MYNPQLDTFLAAAKCGSFTKAAKQLYITPSAVLQQINSLEKNLKVTLFIRTTSGLQLTAAGNYLVSVVEQMKGLNSTMRTVLLQLDARSKNTLRVGVPRMHKSRCFYELWTKYSADHHNVNIDFVDTASGNTADTDLLYSSIDLIEFIRLPNTWQRTLNFLKLGECSIMLDVPQYSPLAQLDFLQSSDLRGQNVVISEGPFAEALKDYTDRLAAYGAVITVVPPYSPAQLERCYIDGSIMIMPDCSSYVHPGFVPLKCDSGISIPYGFFYSPAADSGNDSFIKFVKHQLDSGSFIWSGK